MVKILVNLFWSLWIFLTLILKDSPEQGIKIVKPTADKRICNLYSLFLCKMLFTPSKIPQLDKTGCLHTVNMPSKREVRVNPCTQIFTTLSIKNIDWQEGLQFSMMQL